MAEMAVAPEARPQTSRWELKHPQIVCGPAFVAGTLVSTVAAAIATKANALLLLKNSASVAIVGGLFTTIAATSYDFSKFSESDLREQYDLTAILTRLLILFISTASCFYKTFFLHIKKDLLRKHYTPSRGGTNRDGISDWCEFNDC